MANISSAEGTIIFNKKFYKRHRQAIYQALQDIVAAPHTYGLDYVEALDGMGTRGRFHFRGSGRWTMSATFATMLNSAWWDDQCPASASALVTLLVAEHQRVDVRFVDYEPGCHILQAQWGHIVPYVKHDDVVYDGNQPLTYYIDDTKKYAYNLANLRKFVVDARPMTTTAQLAKWLTSYGLDASRYPLDKVLQFIKTDAYLQGYVDVDDEEAFNRVVNEFGEY